MRSHCVDNVPCLCCYVGGLNQELLSEGKVVSNCTCSKSTLPKDHAIKVSVDLPCGSGPFPIVWMLHGVPDFIVSSMPASYHFKLSDQPSFAKK